MDITLGKVAAEIQAECICSMGANGVCGRFENSEQTNDKGSLGTLHHFNLCYHL